MARSSGETAKRRRQQKWLLIIAFLLTVVCIVTGSYVQELESVEVGSVAQKRYVAPRDTVDTVATEKKKEEAAAEVGPLYKHDTQVEEQTQQGIQTFFETLEAALNRLGERENLASVLSDSSLNLPVALNSRYLNAYAQLSETNRTLFAQDCVAVVVTVYEQGITEDTLEKGKENAAAYVDGTPWSEPLKEFAKAIADKALQPNLVLDEEAMETARNTKMEEVEDVVIQKGQKIVDEGEIITQEIYDRLVSMNLLETASYRESVLPLAGSLLVTGLIFAALLLFFLWGSKSQHVLAANEEQMLFAVYVIMTIVLRLMSQISYFTLIPMELLPMLLSILIGRRISLVINSFFCIIGCFIFNGDVEFLMYAMLTGSFAAILIQKTDKRSRMVPVALAQAAVCFVTMFAVGLFFDKGYSWNLFLSSAFGALMGMVSVMIAVGSLPVWEAAFEANTPLRLLELTNPNHDLLRKMMIEAPGTYHHSLIVANLAETAAYEIGANSTLARAGAYYHDIGKLKNPLYFGENQSGENLHDMLRPKESAKIILQHVKAGAEMGRAAKLPKAVLAILQEHHGTSLVKFFYFKALKEDSGEEVKEADFRYPGPIPSSRESAVVMLADTVEAAVRSMLGKGKTLEDAEEFIRTLIKDKLDDGQLNHSGLTIDELETIRKAFMKVFQGMYHERVAYPAQKEIAQAQKEKEAQK